MSFKIHPTVDACIDEWLGRPDLEEDRVIYWAEVASDFFYKDRDLIPIHKLDKGKTP